MAVRKQLRSGRTMAALPYTPKKVPATPTKRSTRNSVQASSSEELSQDEDAEESTEEVDGEGASPSGEQSDNESHSSKTVSWAGLDDEPEAEKTSPIIEDMTNYEFSESESESVGAEEALDGEGDEGDEDDYDDVDNISNASDASDDSRAFEKQVELDIEAEGDAVFDWEDEQTYHYDESWNTGLYDIGDLEPMADFDLSKRYERVQSAHMPTEHDVLETYPFSWTEASFSSSDSSPSESPMVIAENTFEPDGDETEDDEMDHKRTISRPGLKLLRDRKSSHRSRLVAGPPPRATDPRRMPTARRVKIDPRRAVAFTANGPLGRSVRYITPKGRAYKWVDLQSQSISSASNSGASSPTMINLGDAMLHGNTRTGAHITDVLHGAIFRIAHCPSSPPVVEQPQMSTFYQSFMFRPSVGYVAECDSPLFEDELIDFEQCDEPSSTAPTPALLRNESSTSVLFEPETPCPPSRSPRKRAIDDLDLATPAAKRSRVLV